MDPSKNLTSIAKVKADHGSTLEFIVQQMNCIVEINKYMHLVPAAPRLANLNNERDLDAPELLKNILEDHLYKYDCVLIDCPPEINMITHNAYTAADYLIIPVTPGKFSIEGLALLKKEFDNIKRMHNPDLAILGVFLNDLDKNTKAARAIQEKAQDCADYLNTKMYKQFIYHSTVVNDASEHNQAICQFNKRSSVCQAYMNLMNEIVSDIYE